MFALFTERQFGVLSPSISTAPALILRSASDRESARPVPSKIFGRLYPASRWQRHGRYVGRFLSLAHFAVEVRLA